VCYSVREEVSNSREGFEDGADKLSQLILRLKEADRQSDIDKVICDKAFRHKLFLEFHLK